MNITINKDGSVSVDTNGSDVADVVKLIKSIATNPVSSQSRTLERPERHQPDWPNGVDIRAQAQLNSQQYRAWSYLVDHDSPLGVHFSALARAFGISDTAAGNRLRRLALTGHVVRVALGRYRAVVGTVKAGNA